jgi:predicted outer membrane protein
MEVLMRYAALSLLVLVVSCSSDNRKGGETGMVEGGAGGLSTRDTMPSTADIMSLTRADSAKPGTVSGPPGTVSGPVAILSEMNVANTSEIQLSTVATRKARSPKVKQIARKLAADHTRNREQLRALAQKLNVTLMPAQGGVSAADSAALPADLQATAGRNFDRAFIDYEIEEHQSNIEKLQTQAIPAAQNADIKGYLQKTVKEMQGHLTSLRQVQKQLRD